MDIRLYGTAADSIVDGPGLRFSVFTQGCPHHCPGCHNSDSQPFEGGTLRSVEDVVEEIGRNKLISGVTLTGGEPFAQPEAVLALARACRAVGYDVWIYSGYLLEDLQAGRPSPLAPDILRACDVLVDGPFVESLKSYDLQWKGSVNQRVIDLAATWTAGKVVLWRGETLAFEKPPSW